MTRKLFKRLGILLGILVLLPVMLTVGVGWLLPKDTLKTSLTRSMAEATGAQVELGEVSVRLWPRLGATLRGGTITGTGADLAAVTGSPNKLEDYRLDLAQFEVGLAVGPLLGRRIVVEEIRLRGPDLTVAWDKGILSARGFDLKLSQVSLPVAALQTATSIPPGPRPPGEMIPPDLTCLIRAQIDSLRWQDLPLDKVRLSGDFSRRVLTVTRCDARLSTGEVSGTAVLDFQEDPWGRLAFTASAQAVPAEVLLVPWVPELALRLDCDLTAEGTGTCQVRDSDIARETLVMVGAVESGEGVLAAADWLGKATPYLGDRQDLKTIRFRSLDHDFRVDQGRYIVEEILIDGHETHWLGSGWVGFDETLDLAVTVKLPGGFTPELGKWSFLAESLRDPQGRVNLGFTLRGPTAKPHVGVDLGNMTGAASDEAAEAVKKGLGGLLDKWKTR